METCAHTRTLRVLRLATQRRKVGQSSRAHLDSAGEKKRHRGRDKSSEECFLFAQGSPAARVATQPRCAAAGKCSYGSSCKYRHGKEDNRKKSNGSLLKHLSRLMVVSQVSSS